MNNVCLCIGNYAKKPFYIKLSDISVYSMEELCYYFLDKVHLIDDSIVTQELVDWIRGECGLKELADELDVYVRKHMSVAAFVSTIFESTGMYDETTRKKAEHILKEQSNLSTVERYKKRAEYLYQQGRFKQALAIYAELMNYIPAKDTNTKAVLYYNMASIYAMDFAYGLAAELYYESYAIKPDRQTRYAYILANKLSMTDYAYGTFRRNNPEWEEDFEKVDRTYAQTQAKWQASREKQLISDLARLKENGQRDEYDRQTQELLKQLKKDYMRQTMD